MGTLRFVALLLSFASPVFAAPHLLEPGTVQLADYHPAAPVASPYRPVPVPVAPVVHARADFFLLGLGLAAGGLVLGGRASRCCTAAARARAATATSPPRWGGSSRRPASSRSRWG